jgi:hypothetical protein
MATLGYIPGPTAPQYRLLHASAASHKGHGTAESVRKAPKITKCIPPCNDVVRPVASETWP